MNEHTFIADINLVNEKGTNLNRVKKSLDEAGIPYNLIPVKGEYHGRLVDPFQNEYRGVTDIREYIEKYKKGIRNTKHIFPPGADLCLKL